MKQELLNQKGEKAGEIVLSDKLFSAEWKPELVKQAALVLQGNKRQVSAKVKDRGEVRGGGRKPWRQKGTGRARHGSSRSPIWVGGGVTHGPTGKQNYKRDLNVKMRKAALISALSEKLRQGKVIVLDALSVEAKTKALHSILSALPLEQKSTLLVLPSLNQNVHRASLNIPYVKTVQAKDVNVLDVVSVAFVVMPKESVSILEGTAKN